MPTPIGHSLAALTVLVVCSERTGRGPLGFDPVRLGLALGAALAPDLDLLFRFVDGRNHHNQETHSVGAALLAAALTLLIARARGRHDASRLGLLVGLCWLSHVLLDYLNVDTSLPIGLLALWPFDFGYYKIPWPIFLDVWRSLTLASLLHNLLAAAWEACVLWPLLLLAKRTTRRSAFE